MKTDLFQRVSRSLTIMLLIFIIFKCELWKKDLSLPKKCIVLIKKHNYFVIRLKLRKNDYINEKINE